MNIGKKLLSLLTVFCLTLSLVPTVALATTSNATSVTIGGVQMVSGNQVTYYKNSGASSQTGNENNYNAKYDPASGTLTLNNLQLNNSGIYANGNLTIQLTSNTTSVVTNDANAIKVDGDLTIKGPGILNATGGSTGTAIYASEYSGTITVCEGAEISATTTSASTQAIHANKIIVTGSGTTVDAISTRNDLAIKANASLFVDDAGKLKVTNTGNANAISVPTGSFSVYKTNGNQVITTRGSSPNYYEADAKSTVTTYSVSGNVTDGSSAAIVGASVQLCSTTGTANANASAVISTSTTTESGTYSFSNVPAGKYTITASKEGYSASTGASVNVTVNNADVTTGTDLTLSLIKYNVYVNGTQVTWLNKDNVLNDSGQTVKYTPASEDGITPQKLTLNGAKIVNGTNKGIKASDDLMIDLIGENTINATSNAIYLYHETTEATSPKLTITSNQSGTLSMTSSNASTTVYAYSDITINGSAKVNATINGTAQAIHSPNGNIIIGGTAEVTATNEYSTTSTINSIAVLVGTDSSPSGTIEVKDSASLKAQGHGKALGCTKFTYPANGYVAKGSTDYAPTNPGEYVANDLATYKYVEVKHEGATPTTFDVTLTNGTGYTLSATDSSSTPVTSGGSYSFTLDIADSYKRGNNFAVKANGSELTAGADGKYTISNIRENQTITVEGVVEITKYQVWVNGTQVTEANKDNVLGDNSNSHSVIYTPANEDMPAILTLNNANIVNTQMPTSGGMYYISPNGITAKEDLKINVIGTNKIESKYGNPINATKNLTISDSNTANNSLELKSKDNMTVLSLDYTGPYNLIISGSVNVKAIVETNVIAATSVSANKMIIQDNAKVTAINHGKNMAIYCRDALTVKDSATLIAQSENNNHAVTVENGFTYPGHIIEASKNFAGTNPDETYNPEKLDPGVNKKGYKYVEVRPTSGTVITGIKLNKELSMKVGTTDTLTPVFTPTDATEKTVTWTSSDKTVATVDQNGKVTAVGVGTATITVLTKDGGYTDTCTVTVSNPSSSSGSHTTYYPVNTPAKSEGGSVVVSQKSASKGSAVTVTVTPESGYQVSSVQAVDEDGKKLTLTDKGDGKYSFVMPGSKVEVSASFAQVQKPEETSPYRDVSKDSYYYDAVQWASNKGITNGVADGVFAPDWICTRGQIVTFLWRSVGSPTPKTAEMPFADVAEDAYYAQAVLWAVENGITKGTSETTFSPDQTCTRAHAVAFLYRLVGSPAVTGSSFQDVAADAYYNAAVAWAVQQGITNGTSETTFSPDETCTRAQIVTFLYRMDQAK